MDKLAVELAYLRSPDPLSCRSRPSLGVTAGVGLSLLLMPLLRNQLYAIEPRDPVTRYRYGRVRLALRDHGGALEQFMAQRASMVTNLDQRLVDLLGEELAPDVLAERRSSRADEAAFAGDGLDHALALELLPEDPTGFRRALDGGRRGRAAVDGEHHTTPQFDGAFEQRRRPVQILLDQMHRAEVDERRIGVMCQEQDSSTPFIPILATRRTSAAAASMSGVTLPPGVAMPMIA